MYSSVTASVPQKHRLINRHQTSPISVFSPSDAPRHDPELQFETNAPAAYDLSPVLLPDQRNATNKAAAITSLAFTMKETTPNPEGRSANAVEPRPVVVENIPTSDFKPGTGSSVPAGHFSIDWRVSLLVAGLCTPVH